MNYSLALELKKAGFPQHGREIMTPHTSDIKEGKQSVYYPTLDELIDACPSLYGFRKVRQDTWEASEKGQLYGEEGATPTEAVAKLWLSLQAENETT